MLVFQRILARVCGVANPANCGASCLLRTMLNSPFQPVKEPTHSVKVSGWFLTGSPKSGLG